MTLANSAAIATVAVMKSPLPRLLILVIALSSCAKPDPETMTMEQEWQAATGDDDWAQLPDKKLRARFAVAAQQPCVLVTEEKVETANGMLEQRPAVALGPSLLEEWVGSDVEGEGVPIMMRAFDSANGINRVAVIGDDARVWHDALAGFSRVHRHPCVARLGRAPREVYSDAGYGR